jgi:hypothetical protein
LHVLRMAARRGPLARSRWLVALSRRAPLAFYCGSALTKH